MNRSRLIKALLSGCCLLATIGMTGCQTTSTGATSPSPTYLTEDVKYFPAGAKFKLTQEAAAMKAYSEQQAAQSAAQVQTTLAEAGEMISDEVDEASAAMSLPTVR